MGSLRVKKWNIWFLIFFILGSISEPLIWVFSFFKSFFLQRRILNIHLKSVIFFTLLLIIETLFFGFHLRVFITILSFTGISLVKNESNNSHFLLFFFLLVIVTNLDLVQALALTKNGLDNQLSIPNIGLYAAYNIFISKSFISILLTLTLLIIYKPISLLALILGGKIIKLRLGFFTGFLFAISFPLVSLILGLFNIGDGTSLVPRFRGWVLIYEYWNQNFFNILFKGPFSGVKEDFFWPGDIGIFGSIYELGFIQVCTIWLGAFLYIKFFKPYLSNLQLFLLGYYSFTYLGRFNSSIPFLLI